MEVVGVIRCSRKNRDQGIWALGEMLNWDRGGWGRRGRLSDALDQGNME